ncbi:Protein transport protein Sec31A [Hordeum vulgare]|nr:Protein transport protein Sec31A [Hordeum vulgare]
MDDDALFPDLLRVHEHRGNTDRRRHCRRILLFARHILPARVFACPAYARTPPVPVMKTEWDIAGGGVKVVVCIEGVEDFIPTNRWLKRVNLPRRVTFMSLPHPRIGHEKGSRELLCFYVQIKDMEYFAMPFIPPKFVEVMKEWLEVKLPRIVRLSANKWFIVLLPAVVLLMWQ